MVAMVVVAASAAPAFAQVGAAPVPAGHGLSASQAETSNHLFLVKLLSAPAPVPYQSYFAARFAVFDPSRPDQRLKDVTLSVAVGMRHGMARGFAHGMQTSPQMTDQDGVFTLSGMYFHMSGAWDLEATVHEGDKQGIAYFTLPCCGG